MLVSLISPFRAERFAARERIGDDFVEIFVDTPIEVCRARDPKGLYAKADRGEILNFTGVDSPYEKPETPDLKLDSGRGNAEKLAAEVVSFLVQRKII